MYALITNKMEPVNIPARQIEITKLDREYPDAKIAVSSFLDFNLLIENRDAIKHETGNIFIKNDGHSKTRSLSK
jgi:hypothetical protein